MQIEVAHIYKCYELDGKKYFSFEDVALCSTISRSNSVKILEGEFTGNILSDFRDNPQDENYYCEKISLRKIMSDPDYDANDLDMAIDLYREDYLYKNELFMYDAENDIRDFNVNPGVKERLIPRMKKKNSVNDSNFTLEPIHYYYEKLIKSIIGQDEPAKRILTTIYNHQKLIRNKSLSSEQIRRLKNNFFVVGASGEGKTEIIKIIAELLNNIPFLIEDSTKYSQVGFVGDSIDDALRDLVKLCNNDVKKAESGIIVFDEIDKKRTKDGDDKESVSSSGVQYSLLSIMQGNKINVRENSMDDTTFLIDTSTIQFGLMGAFVESLTKTEKRLGFGNKNITTSTLNYNNIKAKDLIDMGMVTELVGRTPSIIGLNKLDVNDYEYYIKHSNISELLLKQEEFRSYGVDLKYDDEFVKKLALASFKRGIGIRGVKNVLNEILDDTVYDLHDGTAKEVLLNGESIEKGKALILK